MCVVIANVFDQCAQRVDVGRQEPLCHIVAQEIAKQTPEILVPNKREQRARTRGNANGTPQKTETREGIYLFADVSRLGIRPPAHAELQLSWYARLLKIARHRAEHVVVGRVHAG